MTTAGEPRLARTFASLRVRNYRIVWTTGVISNVGTAMQGIALDWLVLTRTHNGTAVGLTAGLQYLPLLVFGLFSGAISDRFDRRPILMAAQCCYAAQAGVLGGLVLSHRAPLPLIYGLAFALGCVFTVENPARLSFVRELVPTALISNAAGLNIVALNASRLIGTALGGVLISGIGTGWVFVVNACSFGVVFAGLLSVRPARSSPPATKVAKEELSSTALAYTRARPELLAVFVTFGIVATLATNFQTTLTLFAGVVFHAGPRGLGFLWSALGLGTIAGSLIAAGRVRPTVRQVLISAAGFGAIECAVAAAPTYAVLLLLLVPVGFVFMTLNTAVSAFVQSTIDDAVRGRVMALYTVVSMGGAPFGAPAIGWICQRLGTRWGVGIGAGAAVLAAGLGALTLARRTRTGALVELVMAGDSATRDG